jgi:hypothetical protein
LASFRNLRIEQLRQLKPERFYAEGSQGPATCRKTGPPTSSAVAQWVSDTDGMLFSRTKPISPFEIKVRQQPKARNSRSTASVIAAMMVALERRLTFPRVRAALGPSLAMRVGIFQRLLVGCELAVS